MRSLSLLLHKAVEITRHSSYNNDKKKLLKTLSHLRTIGISAIEGGKFLTDHFFTDLLRQIINIFKMMSTSDLETVRDSISVPIELNGFLEACAKNCSDGVVSVSMVTECEKSLAAIIADTAAPTDIISTFAHWNRSNEASSTVLSVLRSSLTWGARIGAQKELSFALLRISQARNQMKNASTEHLRERHKSFETKHSTSITADGRIWQKLTNGDVAIKK